MSIVLNSDNISWLDYAIFAFSLCLSLGVGLYHGIKNKLMIADATYGDGKVSKKDEYMMGGHDMPPLPVALSLLTTFLSGVLMLAVPAEMFLRGAHIWVNFVIGAFSSFLTAIVFLPVFHKMHSTCLHDYFTYRYNSQLIRLTFSALFLLFTMIYMSVVIYSPSVALSPVLGIDKNILILVFGLITTLYTTIGGLKAVIWTDSLQAVMMYAGVFVLIYKGLTHSKVGGIGRVLSLAVETGRVKEMWRIDPNPAQFNSLWINVFSGTVTWLAGFGVNQLAVQRYFSIKNISNAKCIIYFTMLPFICLCSIVSFVGFIALAYFYNCNPLETGQVKDADHLTIVFAKDVLSPTPGLFGLYVSCIMSATLSTLSSGMNSMAAAAYEDFLKNRLEKHISDTTATRINKAFVCVFGILSTILAFAAGPLGGILRVCVGVMGAISGPLVGIFVLAMFWPKAGVSSTFYSFIISNVIMAYICYLNYSENPYRDYYLPTNSSSENCQGMNFTARVMPSYDAHYGDPSTSYLSRLSVYSYSGIGMLLMLLIAILLNYIFEDYQDYQEVQHLTYYGRNIPWPAKTIKNCKKSQKIEKTNQPFGQEQKLMIIVNDQ